MARAPHDRGPSPSSGQFERSARLCLRAYPRRWRAAFGDDLVRVLTEVSPTGSRRVPAREAAAIVRSGWALRLREHPPLLRWLAYRLLDIRLPLRYQHWVVDDILGTLWWARFMSTAVLVWAVVAVRVLMDDGFGGLVDYLLFVGVLVVVFTVVLTGPFGIAKRRAAWQRHISPEVPWSLLATRDKARTPRESLALPWDA